MEEFKSFSPSLGETENILKEDGEPNLSRIPDANAARGIYVSFMNADLNANFDRALIQKMYDGEPPYADDDLVRLGQAERCNLNFGDAYSILEQSMTAYNDLVNSVPCLFKIKLRLGYAPAEKRMQYEQIIAEELHRMNRRWPKFEFNVQLLASYFIRQGVSIAFFEDEHHPFWQVSRLGDFLTPHNILATEQDTDVAISIRYVTPHELYRYIRDDEKAAKEAGWNVEAVKEAILHYSDAYQQNQRIQWEEIQDRFKNNDLYQSYARSQLIKIGHVWVKEFNNKVSHHIFLSDVGDSSYLFTRLYRYDSIEQAFIFFTYGIGNGFLHSIRGQGYKIYPQIQVLNQLKGQAVDMAKMSSTLFVQPRDTKSMDEFTMTFMGPYTILPPTASVSIQPMALPDLGKGALPVISMMQQGIMGNAGTYLPQRQDTDSRPTTAKQAEIEVTQQSTLSTGALNLFYNPLTKVFREQVRRIKNFGDTWFEKDPGGQYVAEFYKRITERGVPVEAVKAIEDVHAVRAIGYGSATQRQQNTQAILQLSTSFDPVGRHNALRNAAATYAGWDEVDAFVPPQPDDRASVDTQIATLENSNLLKGMNEQVLPSQDHYVHLQVHFPPIMQMLQQLGGQQMIANQAYPVFAAVIPHLSQHLQILETDQARQAEVKAFRQQLSQLTAAFDKITQSIQAQQNAAAKKQQQQQQQQQQAGQGQGQPQQGGGDAGAAALNNAKIQATLQESAAKMQAIKAIGDAKIQALNVKTAQDLHLKDLKNASDLQTSDDEE